MLHNQQTRLTKIKIPKKSFITAADAPLQPFSLNSFISMGAGPYPSVARGKGTKLVFILQKNFSKIVDENVSIQKGV